MLKFFSPSLHFTIPSRCFAIGIVFERVIKKIKLKIFNIILKVFIVENLKHIQKQRVYESLCSL